MDSEKRQITVTDSQIGDGNLVWGSVDYNQRLALQAMDKVMLTAARVVPYQ